MTLTLTALLPLVLTLHIHGDTAGHTADGLDHTARVVRNEVAPYPEQTATWASSWIALDQNMPRDEATDLACAQYESVLAPKEGGLVSVVLSAGTRAELADGLGFLAARLRETGELDHSEQGQNGWFSFLAEYSTPDGE